ncbi:MAG: ribosome-binding factor A [Neolewinella sp.]|jgi:ribosome-binding factor A
MNERRLARLKQQIKQRLAEVLHRDLADPKLGMVTITRIELDTEFSHCKAYWSVLAGSDQEEKAKRDSAAVLGRARGFCQREMARVLHTRSVPHLEFLFDEGIGAAIRMNKLLNELHPEGETAGDETTGDGATGDAPAGDSPAVSPATEAPASDEAPASEAPASEAPASEAPAIEPPAAEPTADPVKDDEPPSAV